MVDVSMQKTHHESFADHVPNLKYLVFRHLSVTINPKKNPWHGLGSSGGGWDDVLRGATSTAPVLQVPGNPSRMVI